MNVVIIGAGAIGRLFYQAFVKSPHINTSLLTRYQNENAFLFTNLEAVTEKVTIVKARKDTLAEADVVLVCVKSYQVIDVVKHQLSKLKPNALVIFSHNGMISRQSIQLKHRQLLLLTTHGCKKTADNHVVHTGGGIHHLGVLSGAIDKAELSLFIDVINEQLPSIQWQENIQQHQWLKLAINCVINPLTALNNMPNGDVLSSQYQQQVSDILKEFVLVAEAEGLIFKLDELLQLITTVATKTAQNTSSMRGDVLAKRQTEVENINGFIVKRGQHHHIATPVNQRLYQQILSLS